MNTDKGKIMSNVNVTPSPAKIGGSTLEVVNDHLYLEQSIQKGKSNFEKEVNCQIQLCWAEFGMRSNVFFLVQNTAVSQD